MGGSSSKHDIIAPTKKPLKNYNNDENIKAEAAKKGLDKNLLAY